ncbi:MAG: hypothetical protein LBC73_08590 [Oscillospiraceae bacterium]|jgi:hypothetical protein|nr:hypothetical protein [Oscillospiraceae bacterium]
MNFELIGVIKWIKLGIVILLAVIMIVFMNACIVFYLNPTPGLKWMEDDFQQNKESLYIVKNFLVEREHGVIIRSFEFDEKMLIGDTPIDEKTIDAINELFHLGYSQIRCYGNWIVFLRWSTRHEGRGIVFSIDGSIPDESEYPYHVSLELLSEDGWYFYISNYREWVRRNS